MPDTEFSNKVIQAVDARTIYYNTDVLPKMLDKYRLIHTCVKNLIDVLIQKSIIKPDPYKLEKKISDVEIIPTEPFLDTERALVIGTRLSDYEGILDFVCTYYKFSVENMTFAKIKKFVDFNNTFNWHAFNTSSPSVNTKGFATLISEAKHGAPVFTINTINDSILKCDNITKEINVTLKELGEYQKEVYKCYIRKDVFDHPKFDSAKASESIQAEVAEIKKIFPLVMNKAPFYTALVEEIAKEDLSPDRTKLQNALLNKLQLQGQKTEKKEKQIDTKDILMHSVLSISALAPQLETVVTKLNDNKDALLSEHRSFWDKLVHNLRKAFNVSEPPVLYQINITDSATGTISREKIDFQLFIGDLQRKINYYNSFAVRHSPGFQKIENNPPEKILEFINKQIAEAQRMVIRLNALDDFFKNTANPETKKNIKGIKMELTSMKNTIVNTNQHRVEYISLVEEQNQMKKLGIVNE